MDFKDFLIVGIIVLLISIISSFFGASPLSVVDGVIVFPDDTDVEMKTHHGEVFYNNFTNPKVISIAQINLFYNITHLNLEHSQFIEYDNMSFIIQRSGFYRVIATVSFSGGNSGNYEFKLTNGLSNPHCAFFRTTTTTNIGDGSLTCIDYFNAGDKIRISVRDTTAPAQSISIYAMNFNVFEIH